MLVKNDALAPQGGGEPAIVPMGAAPAGRNSLEHSYTPTGDLRIPAFTLSTFRDPVIPGFHRTVYGQEVAAMGDSARLVQRSVAGYAGGYGHCTFTPQELTQAFSDLILCASG